MSHDLQDSIITQPFNLLKVHGVKVCTLQQIYSCHTFTGLKMRRDNTALLLYKKTQFQSKLYFPDVLKFLLNSVLHKDA